jgi:acetate kinase
VYVLLGGAVIGNWRWAVKAHFAASISFTWRLSRPSTGVPRCGGAALHVEAGPRVLGHDDLLHFRHGLPGPGGLMMGTRTGDLDPGILLYLRAERKMTPTALNELVNRKS